MKSAIGVSRPRENASQIQWHCSGFENSGGFADYHFGLPIPVPRVYLLKLVLYSMFWCFGYNSPEPAVAPASPETIDLEFSYNAVTRRG